MSCERLERVPEYFDGELDAHDSAVIERHLRDCAACTARLEDLRQLRGALREQAPYFRAPAAMRSKLRQALDRETRRAAEPPARSARTKLFWQGAVSGALAAAAVAAIVFLRPMVGTDERLVEDITSAHLRSLLPNRLLDVVSTDQHTVRPWFAGHADVAPPAVDFSRQGYPLIGGRIDYVGDRRAAVVVYRHGAHIANVFVWADAGASLPRPGTDRGYHTRCWHGEGQLAFCAVSDMGASELTGLARLLQGQELPAGRE